jgi:hypothetical protein
MRVSIGYGTAFAFEFEDEDEEPAEAEAGVAATGAAAGAATEAAAALDGRPVETADEAVVVGEANGLLDCVAATAAADADDEAPEDLEPYTTFLPDLEGVADGDGTLWEPRLVAATGRRWDDDADGVKADTGVLDAIEADKGRTRPGLEGVEAATDDTVLARLS